MHDIAGSTGGIAWSKDRGEEDIKMQKQIKAIPFEIKEINEEERSFLAVASTEDLDRDNDRIMSAGWDLDNFLKNPVVTWAHKYSDPPVARATEVKVENGRLMFRPKFATKDDYDFADTIYRLYKGGYLRSFSVGFMPKRFEIVDRGNKGQRGYDFLEQELWEISACTVPSNPNALVAAKAKGIISDNEFNRLDIPLERNDKAIEDETTNKDQESIALNDKRLEIEKRLDELEKLVEDRDAESRTLNERLDAIEETLKTISEAVRTPDADEAENPDTRQADGGQPFNPDTDISETKTLELDPDELTMTIADIVQGVIDRNVGDTIKYHLGQVD
jgi:HK97 family phage prohead protease